MQLLFVGTGAADYETVFTCSCPVCTYVRARGARNLRHYSSLLVEGRVLIDCGPTAAWRLAELDVPPGDVEAVVFTHSHEDHLDVGALQALLQARAPERGPLPCYGNAGCLARLADVEGLETHLVRAEEPLHVQGLELLPLPARHLIEGEETLIWVVGDPGGRLLYATDTAYPAPDTMEALKRLRLDAVIAEATFGLLEEADHPGYMLWHMNWPLFGRLREELLASGVIGDEAPFVATHLSQHLVPPHDDFSLRAQPPVAVAYDGMKLSI